MRIFLIGFMGCGKTTVGRKLASQLDYPFIDLDKQIVSQTGMPIQDYFREHGESKFRELERDTLRSTASENVIVATGGGAPCFFDNMDWMNANGTTVYIMMPPKALASRLQGASDRPLINGLHGEELTKFIETKLAEREPFYKQAKYLVNGIDLTGEKLAAYFRHPLP